MNNSASMWNDRYGKNEYAYGTAPNAFLKSVLDTHPIAGKMLFPAEGEGRNAVYAAQQGLDVSAFDISTEGQKKALKLAESEGVNIRYEVGDFFELDLAKDLFDAVALIYAHFPPPILSAYHRKLASMVNPGGLVIAEGFSKGNLALREANPKVGGPNNIDMLFSTETFTSDFSAFEPLVLEEAEVELNEGHFHIGTAKVIRFVGKKR